MSDKIQDFGEKIGGAKKDLAAAKARGGLTVSDISDWTDAEREKHIKKDTVFPKPDYQQMVDDGMPMAVAYFIKKVRDALPTKPVFSMGIDTRQQGDLRLEEQKLSMEVQRISHYLHKLKENPNLVFPGEKMLYGTENNANALLEETKQRLSDTRKAMQDVQTEAPEKAQNAYISFMEMMRDKCGELHSMQDCIGFADSIRKDIRAGVLPSSMLGADFFRKISISTEQALEREMKKKEFLFTKEEKARARYFIAEYDGENVSVDAKAKALVIKAVPGYIFYIYDKPELMDMSKWEKGTYFALDVKGRSLLGAGYPTPEDALSEAMDAPQSKSDKKEKLRPPQLQSIERIGEDYRNGENITGDIMTSVFGFRAGEFGNYESQNDRQTNLNMSFEALKDLTAALGVEDRDASLGGKLAIAFGARGSGNALAHFEPDRNVINLTKTKGAGTLGHEFGHALDYFIARELGLKQAYASEGAKKQNSPLYEVMKAIKSYRGQPSAFYRNACVLDDFYSKEDKGYWNSDVEMFARAFHTYLLDKLKEAGVRSDYLCGTAEFPPVKHNGRDIYTYPRGEERKAINHAFDRLISMLKEKECLHERTEEVKETTKEAPAEEIQGVQLSFDLDMTEKSMEEQVNVMAEAVKAIAKDSREVVEELAKTVAAQKAPPEVSVETIQVHCRDIDYDFTDHPDYQAAKELALQTVHELYMENQQFELDEAAQMIADGDIADLSDYDGSYLEPFDPARFSDKIQELTIQYMSNLTDVPRNPVITVPAEKIEDVSEEMLKAEVEKTYGVKVQRVQTFGMASNRDVMAQRTYDTIGAMMDNEDYQTFLGLKASIQNYSISNIAMIYSQKPDATAVKAFHAWSKTFDRQIQKGEKGLDIWCPNIQEMKTEEDVDKFLNKNAWRYTEKEIERRRSHLLQEIKEKGAARETTGFRIGKVFDISQTVPRDPEHDKYAEIEKNLHPMGDVENLSRVAKAVKDITAASGFPVRGKIETAQDIYDALKQYADDVLRENPASVLGIKNNTPAKGCVRAMETEIAVFLMATRLGMECENSVAFQLSEILQSKTSHTELMQSGRRVLFQDAFKRGSAFADQFQKEFDKTYEPPVQQVTAEAEKPTVKTMVSLEQLFKKVRLPSKETGKSASFKVRLQKNLELFTPRLPDADLALSEFKAVGSVPVTLQRDDAGAITVHVGSQELALTEKEAAVIEKRLTEKTANIER